MEYPKTVHVADRAEELDHDVLHDLFGHFVGVYVVKQVSALAKLGHNVKVVCVAVDVV